MLTGRYLKANRYLAVFMSFLYACVISYNWMVETDTRFIYYLPFNVMQILPMAICAILTHIKVLPEYYSYRRFHIIMASLLFISSLSWIAGQPLVLLLLGDSLILDPMDSISLFFIFVMATTKFQVALISATTLIFIQLVTCIVGLSISASHSFWPEFLSYLVNNFVALFLSYLFAMLAAYSKEQMMRQCYLVKHFQREEAHIIASSRIRLQITEAGMKAMRHLSSQQDLKTQKDRLRKWSQLRKSSSSATVLGTSPPKTLLPLRMPSLPAFRIQQESNSILDLLRVQTTLTPNIPGSPALVSEDPPFFASPLPQEMDDLETSNDRSLFMSIIHEFPVWLYDLPHIMHSKRRKSLRDNLQNFIKYRICMHPGDEDMENSFIEFYNPVALVRFKMMLAFVLLGNLTIIGLNYLADNLQNFDMIVRLGYLTFVVAIGFLLVAFKGIHNHPMRTQITIVAVLFFVCLGYAMLTFNAHDELRYTFSLIDPNVVNPTLNTPSSDRHNAAWLPKSPFDKQTNWNYTYPGSNTSSVATPEQIEREQLMYLYLKQESVFMGYFSSLIVYCFLTAGSSGLRLGYYLIFECLFMTAVATTATYSSLEWGFDGQRVRLVLFVMATLASGTWFARPLESEMRKWVNMKDNYQL